MEGKDAIIKKIMDDASAKADALVADADRYASGVIEAARKEAEASVRRVSEQAERNGIEYVRRREAVAALDQKRAGLNARTELLGEVYDRALEIVLGLPDAKYRKFIEGMLDAAAEDGDTVTIAERDKKRLTSAFFASYAEKRKIRLSLSKKRGDWSGGVILSGKGVDKNLTLEVELKLLREETESETARLLFGV